MADKDISKLFNHNLNNDLAEFYICYNFRFINPGKVFWTLPVQAIVLGG